MSSMAHPSWGRVPTVSEGCAGATLLRSGTAEPEPARAEGTAPAAAAPLPTGSSTEGCPGGRGPWKPGEGDVGSWVPSPCLSLPPPPTCPLPTLSYPSPCPSPSPVSCRVYCGPTRPLLQVSCPAVLGPRWSWYCLMGYLDPIPSSAMPSGCALASDAACPGRRSYRKGAGESLGPSHISWLE